MIPPPIQTHPKRRPYWILLAAVAILVLLIAGVSTFQAGGRRQSAELDAATARARKELPSFIEALKHPKSGMRFFVRAGFGPAKAREILWVRNVSYASGGFRGTLDQDPRLFHGARKGDEVTVADQDIFDWAIKDGSRLLGRYTEQILSR